MRTGTVVVELEMNSELLEFDYPLKYLVDYVPPEWFGQRVSFRIDWDADRWRVQVIGEDGLTLRTLLCDGTLIDTGDNHVWPIEFANAYFEDEVMEFNRAFDAFSRMFDVIWPMESRVENPWDFPSSLVKRNTILEAPDGSAVRVEFATKVPPGLVDNLVAGWFIRLADFEGQLVPIEITTTLGDHVADRFRFSYGQFRVGDSLVPELCTYEIATESPPGDRLIEAWKWTVKSADLPPQGEWDPMHFDIAIDQNTILHEFQKRDLGGSRGANTGWFRNAYDQIVAIAEMRPLMLSGLVLGVAGLLFVARIAYAVMTQKKGGR